VPHQRDHRAVVGAEHRVGKEDLAVAIGNGGGKARAQFAIGADAARDDQSRVPSGGQRRQRLADQHVDHGALELARDVGLARRVQRAGGRLAADHGQHRGLEAGEAHVEVAAVVHRPRQADDPRPAVLGQPRERRAARISQPQQLGGLVEGLAGRVVLRLAEQPVTADAGHLVELRVAAGDQQRDERKAGPRLGEQRRQQVSLKVMDADHRLAQREQRVGDAGADQQRTSEAGALVQAKPRSPATATPRQTAASGTRRTWSRDASSGTTPP
jgi:hypothetical protein